MTWNIRWTTWGLLGAALSVLVSMQSILPGERAITDFLTNLPPDRLWDFFNEIVKTKWLFGSIVLAATLVIYVLFPPRETVIPLASLMGGIVIDWILTPLIDRPRPSLISTSASFPSGGAIYWAAWLGGIALVVWRRMRPGIVRTVFVYALVVAIALGGIARLATGSHWLTDVLGAWTWAAAWVFWLHGATRQVN
jgi:membrane-associated phospholipid phosphatase